MQNYGVANTWCYMNIIWLHIELVKVSIYAWLPIGANMDMVMFVALTKGDNGNIDYYVDRCEYHL